MIIALILIIVLVALLFGARAAKGCLLALIIGIAILIVLVSIGAYLSINDPSNPFNR